LWCIWLHLGRVIHQIIIVVLMDTPR